MSQTAIRLREKLAQRVPKVLTLFPFEVFVAALTLGTGIPVIVGLLAAPALVALVGVVAFYAWAACLVLGGATIVAGLRWKRPIAISSGLQLSAMAFVVYAVAAVVLVGLAAAPGLLVYLVLTLVSLVRSLHFRRIEDIQTGATTLREECQ